MKTDDIYRLWPGLAPSAGKSSDAGKQGGASAQAGKLPDWVPVWARDWGPVQWMASSFAGLVLLHIILAGPFLVLLGWLGFRVTKKGDAKDEKSKTSDSSGLMTLIILALIAWGGYVAYDKYVVNASPDAPLVKPMPAISAQNAGNYEVHINTYVDMPHVVASRQSFSCKLGQGSYVTESVRLTVVCPQGTDLDITLDGRCASNAKGTERVCRGNFATKYGHAGVYVAEWNPTRQLLEVSLKDVDAEWKLPQSHAIGTLLIKEVKVK